MKNKTINNNRGFTLLEIVLTFSMMMVMSFALGSLIIQMRSQLKGAERKYELLEYRSIFSRAFSDLPVCTCNLSANTSPIDITNLTGEFDVTKISSNCAIGAPVIAEHNVPIPGTQTGLAVDKISLTNVEATATVNEYKGKLKIGFLAGAGMPSLRGFEIETHFILDPATPNNAKIIQSCTSVAAAGGSASVVGMCPVGKYLIGLTATSIVCEDVAGASNASGPYSPSNPGPGCEGMDCVTSDFGPCDGMNCRTNGVFCDGMDCKATGVGASCSGMGCCAGPACISGGGRRRR